MENITQFLKELGVTKVATIFLTLLIVVVGTFVLSAKLSKPVLSPLFSGLDGNDSSRIIAQLEGMGIYYEVKSGGSQILVPVDKALSLRMAMAKEGLPGGGSVVGYEIFDKSDGIGSSSFVNDVNLLRALEGELARTISSFASISNARVHLVVPRRNVFSRTKQEPSASIVLKVNSSEPLTKSEVGAITHLVATAVPGLAANRITVVDTQGRPFKLGANDESDPGVFASTTDEYKVGVEKRLKNMIEELVARSVGIGRVEAQVAAEIDFDRTITNSEIYDPDGQVARSIQSTEERQQASEKSANVTAANNIPGAIPTTPDGGSENSVERIDEITNFEISKTVKNHISETGTINKLSIAVLVDGNYDFNEEMEAYTYSPRAEEELKKIEELVKSAVGFDGERGDKISVINMRFSTEVMGVEKERPFEWIKRDLGNILQTVIVGTVVILVILLVVKPMVNRAFEFTRSEDEETELRAALAGNAAVNSGLAEHLEEIEGNKMDSIIDIDKFEEKMKSSSLGAINDIINKHPEETVSIIRSWIERGS